MASNAEAQAKPGKNRKVIITCAVTGSVHTPSMTPYLPITPDEIARESIAAAEAGASVIHLHARDPKDGRPTPNPDVFMQFLPRIKQNCDAVINITTGGSVGMTMEDRLAAPLRAKPELCSLNMGSMNFGIFHAGEKIKDWKYDWEQGFVEGTRNTIASNTFTQIERFIRELGHGCGTRFECECYDIGHLYTLAHFLDRKLLTPPLFVQTIFGVLGGIGTHPEDLAHMRRTADRLFGSDYHWSILAAGRHQMSLATMGATMGANVRVGLEDSIYLGPGQLAKSNADQVAKIRAILENLSLEIATPAEARAMLKLKGGDQVAF
ncbi:MAG: 3-keto-5-aminohexanoate cleavage protein [Proteobacteria bacterium]|nr:3-keto-5-aminohexanoate cleavage protein [Pseudomonadota bacterium]